VGSVGIIANPAAGKDIRRLVAYGTVFDNMEKVNIVKRLLLGLEAAGVEEVWYMPEYFGIVPRAKESIGFKHSLRLKVREVEIPLTCGAEDSTRAAYEMACLGVKCIVTLGGDGTNRAVAKGCGEVPLIPLSTGTNNVFPRMLEGTIAGLAAGLVATSQVEMAKILKRCKRLLLFHQGQVIDMALVDIAVVEEKFIGSRAIWEPEKIKRLLLTRAEPCSIGLSSIGARLCSLGAFEPWGLDIKLGVKGKRVIAPIAPGLILPITVENWCLLKVGEAVEVQGEGGILALDGEREIEITKGEYVAILDPCGPWVVDIEKVLEVKPVLAQGGNLSDGSQNHNAQVGFNYEERECREMV